MTLSSSKMLKVVFLLLSIACSSEGLSTKRISKQHVVPSPGTGAYHQRSGEASLPLSHTNKRITALEQSSVPYPLEEAQDFGSTRSHVLQRIRQGLLALSNRRRTMTAPAVQKQGSLLERHPFLSAISITTINAVVADLLTQLVFQSSGAAWNPQRTLVFGAFGLLYQGMVQYAIVNGVWEKVFPGTSRKAILAKICAMNLLSDPLFFMPTFYIFKQIMAGGLSAGASLPASIASIVSTALASYKANCLIDWRNSWMVWFPGHAVTYGVMPAHKRIPWMAFLGFFYMCVLSITRGAVGV